MKKRLILCLCLTVFLLLPSFSSAKDPLDTRKGLDIVFAVDTSGSMKTNDPAGFAREFLGLFATVADPKGIRVGIVGYSTKLTVSLPLTDISSKEGRASVEKAISSLVPAGDTDEGLGLAEAKRLLENRDENRKKAICLISDGETYDARGGRGEEASAKDTEDVEEWAREIDAEIYRITVKEFGAGDEETPMSTRYSEIFGFFGNNALRSGLQEFFEAVLSADMQTPFLRIAELEGTGSPQEVSLSVPHGVSDAVSVIFVSNAPVSGLGAEKSGLSENLRFFGGKSLSAVLIENPEKGEYKIKFTAKEGERVAVYTFYAGFAFDSEISVSETKDGAARALLVVTKDGEPVSDRDFYESLGARIIFLRLQYAQKEGDVDEEGAMRSYVSDENARQEEIPVSVLSGGVFADYTEEGDESFAVYAATFFHAPFYYKEEVPGSGTGLIIEKEKETAFPWIPVIAGATLILLSIVILLMLFGRKKPVPLLKTEKHPYAGKLTGYITKAENGAEYPPFTFVLSGHYTSDPISLEAVLRFAFGDDLGVAEAAKIRFSPGPSHGLVFSHNTSQTIMLGPLVTMAGESYIMDYGSKLYLMLSNGRTEMELLYKQAGPKEAASYAPGAESRREAR